MSVSRAERDQFFTSCGKYGIPIYASGRFLRYAATLQRLSEAQCNGDYPADNGERKTKECAKCGGFWSPSFIRRDGLCGECKTAQRAEELAKEIGLIAETQGDPRGYVLKLAGLPEAREIGVPS